MILKSRPLDELITWIMIMYHHQKHGRRPICYEEINLTITLIEDLQGPEKIIGLRR